MAEPSFSLCVYCGSRSGSDLAKPDDLKRLVCEALGEQVDDFGARNGRA